MPRAKKTVAETTEVKNTAAEVVAAEVEAAAPAAKKPAAKKTTAAKKPAAKKTAAKTAVSENVYVQFNGTEITFAGLIEKAKAESGVKAPKKVDVYVKPEENMVYYVVDNNAGAFSLS
ncbi:MAG: hypothetical protein J6L05_00570 [Ruminococcus sp.]|nr:hypothetical protein [Ruminococcus sp.]